MEPDKLLGLLNKYKDNTLNEREKQELEDWYHSLQMIAAPLSSEGIADDELAEEMLTAFRRQQEYASQLPARIRRMKTMQRWMRVAAIVMGVCLAGLAWFLLVKKPIQETAQHKSSPSYQTEIPAPANNRAVLILGDGSTIELDSAGNGMVAQQGSVSINKLGDGEIEYRGATTNIVGNNTISLPKGSKPLKLILADGSRVWLNTASSITYPTAFTGTTRNVTINGEAYFEIKKHAARPFIVHYNGVQVKVLGTHFNVNSYADESASKVTLLEGSVQVLAGDKNNVLKPGQQARIDHHAIQVMPEVDLEEVMAWKDGRFYFDGADIKTIMRQVEKWYNVEVEYRADIRDSFVANISREENLSELLKVLQLTNLVHFKVAGNKVIVMK
jgi:Fe2+-dicitrate sensor, membrane component